MGGWALAPSLSPGSVSRVAEPLATERGESDARTTGLTEARGVRRVDLQVFAVRQWSFHCSGAEASRARLMLQGQYSGSAPSRLG